MAATTQKIIVSIVDADGNSITPTPVAFKPEPPKVCEAIVRALAAAGHGAGLLLDSDGDTVLPTDPVQAGHYKYRVTGTGGVAGAAAGKGGSTDAGAASAALANLIREVVTQAVSKAVSEAVSEAVDRLNTVQDMKIAASSATSHNTMEVLKRLEIVFAGGCTCDRGIDHLDPIPLQMVWQGKEDSRDNSLRACAVLQAWLADTELVTVCVTGTPWLTLTVPHLTLTSGRTDLVVLDTVLLGRAPLSDEDRWSVQQYNPPAHLLTRVLECIVLAYECKPLPSVTLASAGHRYKWQCIVEYLAVNCMRAVSAGVPWVPELEVEVYGGNCLPDGTLGVHSIIMPDTIHPNRCPLFAEQPGLRHLHVLLPSPVTDVPAVLRASAQRVKRATRSFKSGGAAMEIEAEQQGAVAPVSSAQHDTVLGPLEAGVRGDEWTGLIGTAVTEGISECVALQDVSDTGPVQGAPQERDDVPDNYHEQAEFNAAVHELLDKTLNQPKFQQLAGGRTPRAIINQVDAYGWAAQLVKAAFEALDHRKDTALGGMPTPAAARNGGPGVKG